MCGGKCVEGSVWREVCVCVCGGMGVCVWCVCVCGVCATLQICDLSDNIFF